MVRALYDSNGMCSFVYDAISLLLTMPRLGIGALDQEADPVASWPVIPRRRARATPPGAWETKASRTPPWAPGYRSAPSWDPHVPDDAALTLR